MEHGHMNGSAHHAQTHLAYHLLKWTYGLLFIVAGLDKFSNIVTMWQQYVGPIAIRIVPVELNHLMMLVGTFEVVLGALILAKPRWGGFLAAAWLLVIAANLLSMHAFYDVAVRDVVMAVGALALALLTCNKE